MREKIFSITFMILFLVVVSSTFAQNEPKDKIDKTSNRTLSLRQSDCTPIDEPAILTILENGDFMIGSLKVNKENLVRELSNRICDKLPSDKMIYVNANDQATFGKLTEVFKIGRDLEVDDFSLVIGDKSESNTTSAYRVKIPTQDKEYVSVEKIKAYPLALFVLIEEDGSIKLNAKPETRETITKRLKQIFTTRKQKKIYKSGK